MRPEEIAKIRRDLEPPWNDLREQRVLGRIQEARRRRPARRFVRAAVGVAFALVCVALLVIRARRDGGVLASNARGAATAIEAGPADREQRMALADGSQAFLVRDARIEIQEQRSDAIRIAQRSGEVRYEVRPDRGREFVVAAAGATVRVRGTIFTVDVARDHVEVRVDRGRVEVDDGARTRELVAGESLRIPGGAPSADDSAVREAAPPPALASPPVRSASPASVPGRPTLADLLARADASRAAGRPDEAARLLARLLATFPDDPRAPDALFMLGKVERTRGRLPASAQAFERCARASPRGPLVEDALAEAAHSWSSAGVTDAAKADAQGYLARWPTGLQATQMRAILER